MANSASPVAIIGMHRSGTSCLAGCLQDLGLELGEVNTAAPHNLKGNRENPRFWPIHDAILSRAGASWDEPPQEPVAWTSGEIADLRAILSDYDGLHRPWGFKDPRATVLLDGWFEALPDLRLVASFRHPLAVAGSLAVRNGFDLPRALNAWTIYNLAVLRWRSITSLPLVDYDDVDYEIKVRAIAKNLALESKTPMPFRAEDLNHQRVSAPVPPSCAEMWAELKAST